MSVQLDVLHAGDLRIPQAYVARPAGGNRLTQLAAVVRPGAETFTGPCLSFVVRHPAEGTILVDTGLHADAANDLRRDFGPLMWLLFRNLRPAAEPFDAQLRGVGVAPEEVRTVVMTHLHVDHTSGMRLLPAAEFVCSAAEWAAATGRGAARNGYVAAHLPPPGRVRRVDLDRDGAPHGPFARTVDLLGDGSIRLLSTPGHTPGHLSVLLDDVEGHGPVLLAGDAAYTTRNIEEQVLPFLTSGDGAARRSLAELAAFADAERSALLVPSHDPAAWRALARNRLFGGDRAGQT